MNKGGGKINVQIIKRFESFILDWDYMMYLLIGGYGSGKSYSIALKIILKLMSEKRTALVVRNVYDTIRESCFSLFKEILTKMDMLSVRVSYHRQKGDNGVIAITSPMELRFPNGSRIIFKGLDNVEKLKSINNVSIVWFEECSEMNMNAFNELIRRIRTKDVSIHFILSCNPVGRENWVYNMFFVRLLDDGTEKVIQDEKEFYQKRTLINHNIMKKNGGVYYHHSVADDNFFLPKSYIPTLDEVKEVDKHLWVVARWGRFGTVGYRVLPNFRVARNAREFKQAVNSIPAEFHFFGLDFGFEESFNAMGAYAVDDLNKILYIYDEVYVNHITDDRFIQREDVCRIAHRAALCDKPIGADSAEPKTIQFYRQSGFSMFGAKKYPGSRLQNTKKMKRFRAIICSPKCKNHIRELRDLTYKKDSRGNAIQDEFNIDAHLFSAMWYALDKYHVAHLKEIRTNSKKG